MATYNISTHYDSYHPNYDRQHTFNNSSPSSPPNIGYLDFNIFPKKVNDVAGTLQPSTPTSYLILIGVLIGITLCAILIITTMILPKVYCYFTETCNNKKNETYQRRKRLRLINKWLITSVVLENSDDEIHKKSSSFFSSFKRQRRKKEKKKKNVAKGENEMLDSSDDRGSTFDEETGNNDNNDDDACLICMEPFKVGDIVSWSSSFECNHVYHEHCITGWLRGHVDCPYCRKVMLPIDSSKPKDDGNDNSKENGSSELLKRLEAQYLKREALTYYSLKEGFVVVDTVIDQTATSDNNQTS